MVTVPDQGCRIILISQQTLRTWWWKFLVEILCVDGLLREYGRSKEKVMRLSSMWHIVICVGACMLPALSSAAEEIVVGMVVPLDAPDSIGNQMRIGVQTYFDEQNAKGGVSGSKLKLVVKDRGLNVADGVAKTRELIKETAPVALVSLMGTGSMESLVKSGLLEEQAIPVVGIRTGAMSLHSPVNPFLFHTRANYEREVDKILTQLHTVGLNQIAVFYEGGAFGKEVLALVEKNVSKRPGMKVLGAASYEPNTTTVHNAIKSLQLAQPQAVIVAGSSGATAEFYKEFRGTGGKSQVVSLSVADGAEIVKKIGKDAARGLIVTQVVPEPSNRAIPIVRDLSDRLKMYKNPQIIINQAIVEGYLAAKVLTEGIRRVGKSVDRRSLRTALDSMTRYDAGGVVINFSRDNHSGSQFVDLAIIIQSGKLMR